MNISPLLEWSVEKDGMNVCKLYVAEEQLLI